MLESILTHRLTFTLTVVVAGLLLRHLAIRRVRKSRVILTADDRKTISTIHYTAVGLVSMVVVLLWLPQLQHFVLSITAITLALVVATKELLLCLSGAVMIRTSRAFEIGDWISVDGRFGEVIECNLLTTSVQEIESRSFTYTGRTATLPNAIFLSATVINQNFLRRYQFHSFSITIEPDAFPIDAEQKLQLIIDALIEPFFETAYRYNEMLEKRTGIDIPDAKPTIEFTTNDKAKLVTTISIFCPTEEIVKLEKAVTKEFFGWYRLNRESL